MDCLAKESAGRLALLEELLRCHKNNYPRSVNEFVMEKIEDEVVKSLAKELGLSDQGQE